jgi:hypothetical protein
VEYYEFLKYIMDVFFIHMNICIYCIDILQKKVEYYQFLKYLVDVFLIHMNICIYCIDILQKKSINVSG